MKHPVQCAKQQEHFASLPRGWSNRGYNCPTVFLLQGNPSKCNWRQRISCTFPLQDRLRHFKALKARTVSIMWYCKSSVSKMVELGTIRLSMNFNGILPSPKWHFALSRMAWKVWRKGYTGWIQKRPSSTCERGTRGEMETETVYNINAPSRMHPLHPLPPAK